VQLEVEIREVIEPFLCELREVFATHPALPKSWASVVSLDRVRSPRQTQPLPMVRALCVSYLIASRRASRIQAARFFGMKPKSVSSARIRHHENRYGRLFPEHPIRPYGVRRPRRRDSDSAGEESGDPADEPLFAERVRSGVMRCVAFKHSHQVIASDRSLGCEIEAF
jgi:hypothetical protein